MRWQLYWGKAAQADSNGPPCHLLAYHALDVAAVGQTLLRQHPSLLRTLADLLGMPPEIVQAWATYFLALHDIGKFGCAFQNQRPDVVDHLGGGRSATPYTVRHDSTGWALWRSDVARAVRDAGLLPGSAAGLLDVWARCVTGHHGQPPTAMRGAVRINTREHFTNNDVAAALEWVDAVDALVGPLRLGSCEPRVLRARTERASWWLAGLAVLADWIGSNVDWFPYEDRDIPLADYWRMTLDRADQAVWAAGVIPSGSVSSLQFADLWPGWSPSPLQAHVDGLYPDGPFCVVVEDVMGAGKTEAALLLAHRLIAAGHAEGMYWALPTMATANALFSRIETVYRRLFTSPSSLTLAHSQRRLVEFLGEDESATARATAWLDEESRRALLAQVGVGTIDQALMGALHTRHNTLRLLGLMGKVLLVDEVHACDAYMRRILAVLLELHARAGGSAILLSATLPGEQRRELLNAWRRGRNALPQTSAVTAYYPLVSVATDTAYSEAVVSTLPLLRRTVRIELEPDRSTVRARLLAAVKAGQCAVWVRNTVRDAIEAFDEFAPLLGSRAELFHARFTMGDRLAIERQILARFGKSGTAVERAGRLLIATQVVEQSLDIDFDLMVTDVAPIDLLLQRAGRLHRHARGPRPAPVLVVHGPKPVDNAQSDWLAARLPGTAVVYPDHGQLWLGLKALERDGGFSTPASVRTLVEEVYGLQAIDTMPKPLQAIHRQAEATARGRQAAGQANAISVEGAYEADGSDWWRDQYTPTRLGEASVTFAVGINHDDRIVPMNAGSLQWALSAVTVRRASLVAGEHDEPTRTLLTTVDVGRWREPLVLRPVGEAFEGAARDLRGRIRRVHYCRNRGLAWA
jgi:CRISPR-associated endonuclease/helicase Cas3